MELKLAQATIGDDGLTVGWDGGQKATFPWAWLRDHGEDESSLDAETMQRKVDTFSIAADLRGIAARISEQGERIRIDWSDNSASSELTARLLASAAGLAPGTSDSGAGLTRTLWAAGTLPDPLPSVGFDALMADDTGLRQWLENIHEFGLSLVEGIPATETATRTLAERMGYIRETIFGGLWTLSAEIEDHGDTAYSTQYLEPHTDATYCHDAPGLQMFNCIEFDGRGGESILVDGFALAEQMRADCREHFDILARTPVPGRYIEPGVHLATERPAIRLDRNGALSQVSFNNYDRAPFLLPVDEMASFYRAYGELHRRIIDQANWLKIPLRPGMALIFDNWRLLHGRMGYTGKRVFCGCYHNREDFESRLRTVAAR